LKSTNKDSVPPSMSGSPSSSPSPSSSMKNKNPSLSPLNEGNADKTKDPPPMSEDLKAFFKRVGERLSEEQIKETTADEAIYTR